MFFVLNGTEQQLYYFENQKVWMALIKEKVINLSWIYFDPSRAEFFRGNKNIYLHFMSFLHIDMTQAFEILPRVRQGPTYSI